LVFRKILPLCLLFTGSANAAFLSQCTFNGVVISEPEFKSFYLLVQFQYYVRAASAAGTYGGDCDRRSGGKTIEVVLNAGFKEVKLIKNNDQLSIDYSYFSGNRADEKGAPIEFGEYYTLRVDLPLQNRTPTLR
jgi:hypothetical protein